MESVTSRLLRKWDSVGQFTFRARGGSMCSGPRLWALSRSAPIACDVLIDGKKSISNDRLKRAWTCSAGIDSISFCYMRSLAKTGQLTFKPLSTSLSDEKELQGPALQPVSRS